MTASNVVEKQEAWPVLDDVQSFDYVNPWPKDRPPPTLRHAPKGVAIFGTLVQPPDGRAKRGR